MVAERLASVKGIGSLIPSPDRSERIVIVGAGQAGGRAAETIRSLGFEGSLTLIGAESERPYERPPLSKTVLLDPSSPLPFLRAVEFYEENRIELRLGHPVQRLDPANREVVVGDGSSHPFERLLIATGGRPKRLPHLENSGVPVLYLRDLSDAVKLREALRPGARIVIVGAGVIGLEIAAAARQGDCDVTVIEIADRVMSRVASPVLSNWVARRHEQAGVKILCGASVAANLAGGVQLADGRVLAADLLVIGIGIRPNDEFAATAGIVVEDGIIVDEWGRTSMPGIFATGDVASRLVPQFKQRLRIETWANAQNHAIAVAHTICGQPKADLDPPWYWTDQFDFNVQVAGAPFAEVDVVRGDPASDSFTVFHLSSGAVVGATTVNNRREMALARRLVRNMAKIDAKELANPAYELRKLMQDTERKRQDA